MLYIMLYYLQQIDDELSGVIKQKKWRPKKNHASQESITLLWYADPWPDTNGRWPGPQFTICLTTILW